MPDVLPQVQQSRVRLLGVSRLRRSTAAPELLSMSEVLPGFDMTVWFGFLAPKGTRADIIASLNAEMVKVLKDPGFQAQLIGMGVSAMPSTPDEFAQFMRSETLRWAQVVKASGARID